MTDAPDIPLSRLLAGQYEFEHEIGRGGMGIVYLARDLKLDRPVAIKTLPPHLAADAQVRERFLREARTAAALSHPNIVPIYRADELDGHVFFAMGYVNGTSMADRVVQAKHLDAREVLREMRDVALALGYAHAHGVIHRDVKAENILIEAGTGSAMVTDFGIARLAEAAPLTATGQVLGTVYYMSPEQVSGEALDGRSDLYSLGVVGYFGLTGRFPFNATLASAVLVAQVTRPAPPLLSIFPDAPRALAEIIDRCLAKDPGVRYQSGEELAEALRRVEGEVARDAARAALAPHAPAVVSDAEAQAIWNRAAELQAMTGIQPRPAAVPQPRDATADAARTSGHDLVSVREAAAEAGIPAQYVEHAMAEHGLLNVAGAPAGLAPAVSDISPRPSWWLGAPTSVELEAVVSGEMPESDFDLLVDVIRRQMEEAGALTAVGRSLTWTSMGNNRAVHVSVVSRNGKTIARAVENMSAMTKRLRAVVIVGGAYLGFGVGMGVSRMFMGATGSIVAGVGAAVGVAVLARVGYRFQVGRRRSRLRRLCEALAREIRDSVTTVAGALGAGDRSRTLP